MEQFTLHNRRLSHRSSHSTCSATAITKNLGASGGVECYVQANEIADLVKVEMKTSKGQWRDSYTAGVRAGRCQPLPTRSHGAQIGRQNLSTALGIKRNKPLLDVGLYFWRSNFVGFGVSI